MNNLSFKLMSAFMKKIKSPMMIEHVLNAADIQPNQKVLDYACGPGIFTILVAKRVGSKGFVYAADIQPLAESYVMKNAMKNGIKNIKFQVTSGTLNIDDESVDRVLLFDCIHMLQNRENVLRELHRVLSPKGILCVDGHHISLEKARTLVEEFNLFIWQETIAIEEKHSKYMLKYRKADSFI